MHCNVCERDASDVERGEARSNVRRFREQTFALWRCPHCRSLHARDEVDLAHYYADYPFHRLGADGLDWMVRRMYRNLEARLVRAGVERTSSILDYGCGSGLFLSFLRERGYADVAGYDAYSETFADPAPTRRRYDCVLTQDVIEHVPEPLDLVRTLHELAKPGGLVVVGTPNAEALDLARPEEGVHSLHQPYHRHILSKRALCSLGADLGWELVGYYPTSYTNTRVPFVNSAFMRHYFRCGDDTLDVAFDALGAWGLGALTPAGLARALLGSWWAPEVDVMAVFRRGNGSSDVPRGA